MIPSMFRLSAKKALPGLSAKVLCLTALRAGSAQERTGAAKRRRSGPCVSLSESATKPTARGLRQGGDGLLRCL